MTIGRLWPFCRLPRRVVHRAPPGNAVIGEAGPLLEEQAAAIGELRAPVSTAAEDMNAYHAKSV